MKRIFALIAVISAFLGGMAQRPLVTLSHDGELSFFSTLSAFEDALNAAIDGDILYLSEGKFTSSSSNIDIKKRVSIVGCGYGSHILADLHVKMYNPDDILNLTLFDGVRLQKLSFDDTYLARPTRINATIAKTWIRELSHGGYAGKNLLIDRCFIEKADFLGDNECNINVQNSKLGEITQGMISTKVTNCNIEKTQYCPRTVVSSIIEATTNYESNAYEDIYQFAISGTHVIYNSWLPKSLIGDTGITTYDCYFDEPEGNVGLLDDDLEATVDLKEKGYLGEDGRVIGIYGGEFPFSENPNVPTIDSANSSVEYDADSNKLNVTITVSPN